MFLQEKMTEKIFFPHETVTATKQPLVSKQAIKEGHSALEKMKKYMGLPRFELGSQPPQG